MRISREVVAREASFDFPEILRSLLTDKSIDEIVKRPSGNVKGMGDNIQEIILGKPFATALIDSAKKLAYEMLMTHELVPDAP